MNEILIANRLVKYLKEKGIQFTEDGYPILKKEWYATTTPSKIVPFNKKQYFSGEKDISICFFYCDESLYPRLERVIEELEIYKNYHSVCMMDISVSPYMLDEVQKFNLLLNLLFIAVLGSEGIKIIPSFRSGNSETLNVIEECIPEPLFWVMGIVGTQKSKKNLYFDLLFLEKLLRLTPHKILCYGKPAKSTYLDLKDANIELLMYRDFRDLSYSKEIDYGRL